MALGALPAARAPGDRAALRPARRAAAHARGGRAGLRRHARAHPPDREQHAEEARAPAGGAGAPGRRASYYRRQASRASRLEQIPLGRARIRDEQLAVRALEAAVARGCSLDRLGRERLVAVRALHLELRLWALGHHSSVANPGFRPTRLPESSLRCNMTPCAAALPSSSATFTLIFIGGGAGIVSGQRHRRRRARERSRDRDHGLEPRPHLGRPLQPGDHARVPRDTADHAPLAAAYWVAQFVGAVVAALAPPLVLLHKPADPRRGAAASTHIGAGKGLVDRDRS